jgi:hypothetical protein
MAHSHAIFRLRMDVKPQSFARPAELLKSVMIKCPTTQLPIGTGIATGANSDLRRYKDQTVQCPVCAQTHTWSGIDAFFE